MKTPLVRACMIVLALAVFSAAPAFAQQAPPVTSPTMAQVIAIHGNMVMFRTSDGVVVGVRVTPEQIQAAHVRVGMPARLIPLPQGHVRVELPSAVAVPTQCTASDPMKTANCAN